MAEVAEVVGVAEVAEEEDQPNLQQPNRQLPIKGTESWKEKNPPLSPVTEQGPTSSCMNSNFTSSSIPPHQS